MKYTSLPIYLTSAYDYELKQKKIKESQSPHGAKDRVQNFLEAFCDMGLRSELSLFFFSTVKCSIWFDYIKDPNKASNNIIILDVICYITSCKNFFLLNIVFIIIT